MVTNMLKVLLLSLVACALLAEETPPPPDMGRISEAFGHMISKNLRSMGLEIDVAKVNKGVQDSKEGKESPMTEVELMEALSSVQEIAFKEKAAENLKKSEEFLAKNGSNPGVKTLVPGKLQYRIEKEGSGLAVNERSTPLIHFSGQFLDGPAFGSKTEEERISLEDGVMPGLEKALVGMKEGEKRVVFVHPELGFNNPDYNLPPSSLVTLELEVIKANAPAERPLDALTDKTNPEIAQPFEAQKAIR
jgi:peptidylprolyl isomerase